MQLKNIRKYLLKNAQKYNLECHNKTVIGVVNQPFEMTARQFGQEVAI